MRQPVRWAAPTALNRLPAVPELPMGRDAETDRLIHRLRPGSSVPVSVLAGAADAGKTALAVSVARAAVHEHDWFPGGVLFIDLRSSRGEGRVTSTQAFGALLRVMEVPDEEVPRTGQEQAWAYHSRLNALAEQDRTVLLVLDDAADAEQVRALLPERGHRVLITARDGLASLPATRIDLSPLDAAATATPAAFDVSYRRLPPRLRLALRLLALHPGPSIDDGAAYALLEGLPSAHLAVPSLAEAGLLTVESQRSGRPGRWRMQPTVRRSAGRLAEQTLAPDARERALDRLLDHYIAYADEALKVCAPNQPDGPSSALFHDPREALSWLGRERENLLACIASAAATGLERAAVTLAHHACLFLTSHRHYEDAIFAAEVAGDAAERTGDRRGRALALFDLGAALADTRRFEKAIAAFQEAVRLFRDLRREPPYEDGVTDSGAEVRWVLEDPQTFYWLESRVLDDLGVTLRLVGRYDEAVDAHRQAADICVDIGTRYDLMTTGPVRPFYQHFWGTALHRAGIAHRAAGRFLEAAGAFRQAAGLFGETREPGNQAVALTDLGGVMRQARRFDEAMAGHSTRAASLRSLTEDLEPADCSREALDLVRQTAETRRVRGSRPAVAEALPFLGEGLLNVGERDRAVDAYQEAAALLRSLGNRYDEATALTDLGIALDEAGRLTESLAAHHQAAALLTQLGDDHGEALARLELGISLCRAGRFAEAIAPLERAAAVGGNDETPAATLLRFARNPARQPGKSKIRFPRPRPRRHPR